VTENDPDGGLTVRYLAGPKLGLHIHFFGATELNALLSRFPGNTGFDEHLDDFGHVSHPAAVVSELVIIEDDRSFDVQGRQEQGDRYPGTVFATQTVDDCGKSSWIGKSREEVPEQRCRLVEHPKVVRE
jgi:hypothetical protein